mmetsp:Transcript_19252/g.31905  ORF Transcript_19252/g.31905 Transcript_19252/m.31905 type:complete len:242 (+) Transcript_19252:298-1023(+)
MCIRFDPLSKHDGNANGNDGGRHDASGPAHRGSRTGTLEREGAVIPIFQCDTVAERNLLVGTPLITDKSLAALASVVAISLALFANAAGAGALSNLAKFDLSVNSRGRESDGTVGKILRVSSGRGDCGGSRTGLRSSHGRSRNRSRVSGSRNGHRRRQYRNLGRDLHIGSILGHQSVLGEKPEIPVDHGRDLERDFAGRGAGDGNQNRRSQLVRWVHVSRARHSDRARARGYSGNSNPFAV